MRASSDCVGVPRTRLAHSGTPASPLQALFLRPSIHWPAAGFFYAPSIRIS